MKSGLEEFLKRIEAKPTNETLIDRFMTLALEEEGVDRILYLKKLVGLLLKSNPYAALKAAYVELQEARKEKLTTEYEVGALKDVESCFINLGRTENAALVREEINKLASGTIADPANRPAKPSAAPARSAPRPASKPGAPVKDPVPLDFGENNEPTHSAPSPEAQQALENARDPARPMKTQEPSPGLEIKPIPSFPSDEFKSLATKIEPLKTAEAEKPASRKMTRNAPKASAAPAAAAPAPKPAPQAVEAPPVANDFHTAVAAPAANAPAFASANESSLSNETDLEGETQVSPFLAQKLGPAAAAPASKAPGKSVAKSKEEPAPKAKAPAPSKPAPAPAAAKPVPAPAAAKPAPAPQPQDDDEDDQGSFAIEYTKRNPSAAEAGAKGAGEEGLKDLPEQHFYTTPSPEIDEQYEPQPFFQPDDDDEEVPQQDAPRRPGERTMLLSLEKLNESKDQTDLAAASAKSIQDVDLPVNSGPNFMVLPDDDEDLPALTRETLANMRASASTPNFDPDRSHASLMFQSGNASSFELSADEDTVNEALPQAEEAKAPIKPAKSSVSLFALGDDADDENPARDASSGTTADALADPFAALGTNVGMPFLSFGSETEAAPSQAAGAVKPALDEEPVADYTLDMFADDEQTKNDIAPEPKTTIELKAEPKVEAGVEVKAEPKAEPKVEAKPEPQGETRVEVKVVPRPESMTVAPAAAATLVASIPMHEPELDFALEEAEAEASLHREENLQPTASAKPAMLETWELFQERLNASSAIQISRMQGVDFVKRLLHAKTETPLVQKTLDRLLQFVMSPVTEESYLAVSEWLFEELDPMATHQLLEALGMQDEGINLYTHHLDLLTARHQHRRALSVMRDLLRFELDMRWYRESYPYLVKVWAKLGLEGWHWREEEGSQAFCDRLVRREDPLLFALLA